MERLFRRLKSNYWTDPAALVLSTGVNRELRNIVRMGVAAVVRCIWNV